MPKTATSYRLTEDAHALLKASAAKLGIPQHAVLELAIREYAKANGIRADPADPAARALDRPAEG